MGPTAKERGSEGKEEGEREAKERDSQGEKGERGRKGQKERGKGKVTLLRSSVPLQLAADSDAAGPYTAWGSRGERSVPPKRMVWVRHWIWA